MRGSVLGLCLAIGCQVERTPVDASLRPNASLPTPLPAAPAPTCLSPEAHLDRILEEGVLRVALPNDTTSYFLWRGRAMGFEYEVLQAFANALEVDLQPVRVNGVQARREALRRDRVDVVAGRLAPLSVPGITYSQPLLTSGGTVVQHLPETGEVCATSEVASLDELDGRPVVVAPDRGWAEVFDDSGLPDPILVPLAPPTSSEVVISKLRRGNADLGVVRSDLGELMAAGDGDLVSTPELDGVALTAHVGFRAESTGLRDAFDTWLAENPATLARLVRTYFEDRVAHRERTEALSLVGQAERISQFDDLFELHATPRFDAYLLAAQAYQESRFRPRARSWAGARGLMQLMPRTARSLGVTDPYDPAASIRGAADYLAWLDDYWEAQVPDGDLRRRYVLASYNAGMGHLEDARTVAVSMGGDPEVWADIEAALLALERPRVYRMKGVKYGYVRGTEPVDYVRKIERRAASYRELSVLEPDDTALWSR